jgi:hypothetical protein
MKTRRITVPICCLLLSAAALAQDGFTTKLTANVPFDFVVNGMTFPKGHYSVGTDFAGKEVLLTNTDKPEYSSFLMNTDISLNPRTVHSVPKMIFARNNGLHVLHQIALQNDNHTHDIVHGKDVIELVASR